MRLNVPEHTSCRELVRSMPIKFTSTKGFTLIEVLIAAIVLFAVVSSALLSFQVALTGTQKAADKLELMARFGPIQQHIQKAISDAQDTTPKANLNGVNQLLDVSFSWQAKLENAAPPPERFEAETTRFVKYAERYLLYNVTVSLRYKSVVANYSYLELAMLPEVKELQ